MKLLDPKRSESCEASKRQSPSPDSDNKRGRKKRYQQSKKDPRTDQNPDRSTGQAPCQNPGQNPGQDPDQDPAGPLPGLVDQDPGPRPWSETRAVVTPMAGRGDYEMTTAMKTIVSIP
jgi:hypothetical protein